MEESFTVEAYFNFSIDLILKSNLIFPPKVALQKLNNLTSLPIPF